MVKSIQTLNSKYLWYVVVSEFLLLRVFFLLTVDVVLHACPSQCVWVSVLEDLFNAPENISTSSDKYIIHCQSREFGDPVQMVLIMVSSCVLFVCNCEPTEQVINFYLSRHTSWNWLVYNYFTYRIATIIPFRAAVERFEQWCSRNCIRRMRCNSC